MYNSTRRSFLAGTIGGGMALTLAGCALSQSRSFDAVVLGAGVSGLHAAHLLEEAGLSVAVLEARSRVGGRVLTLKDLPGYPEMSFNSMGAGYGRGLDLSKQLGLALDEVGHRYRFGSPPGLYIGDAFVPEEQGHSPAAIKLAYDHIPYYGRDAGDVSSLMMAYNSGFISIQMAAGGESFAVNRGNYQLPEAMAQRLSGEVITNSPVASIAKSDTRFSINCSDGSEFLADTVVCSLPLPALRKIEFGLAVPDTQSEAIAQTSYQPISIVQLEATTPFWDEDGQSPSMWHDGFASNVIAQRYGETAEQVTGLMVQARGNLALEWDRLGHEAVFERLVDTIENLRPAARGKLKPLHYHSWSQEEYSGGAWAYYQPGQATRFPAAVANQLGSLHFCGEHTEFAARGVEAALASAERVALEAIGN